MELSKPDKTNQLIAESSPYLLQHARNPVHWYPWGEEALSLAKKENKPIFLSIGYSTCHWCHVMAHESFENQDVADIMNQYFINIKVDREERPDLDALYMTAVQWLTGQGGWPMSVWLTPDLKPFYGGTYFPPEDRYGRPGFARVLIQLGELWEKDNQKVLESSSSITSALKDAMSQGSGSQTEIMDEETVFSKTFHQLKTNYDVRKGGFGPAPKFPMPTYLQFLLLFHSKTNNEDALTMVSHTLKQMIHGGIYDQLGGGFARYSTDANWVVPHFEKMLYDNAQLLSILAFLVQITRDPLFEDTLRQSASYILRDMTHSEGGFYCAEDADSEGREGTFYLWTLNQVQQHLKGPAAELFIAHFGITVDGNFFDPHTRERGKNVLVRAVPLEDLISLFAKKADDVGALLEKSKEKMFQIRSKRARPHLDDKIITEWNGLMISALAIAGKILEDPSLIQAAARAAHFIETTLFDANKGILYRSWRRGVRKIHGNQQDYALFIKALLDLFESTGDPHWLEVSLQLHEIHSLRFRNENSGGYFLTPPLPDLLFQKMEDHDNVIPSGNSIAALNGWRLGFLLNRPDIIEEAKKTIQAFSTPLTTAPASLTTMVTALGGLESPPKQIVLIGPFDRPDTKALRGIIVRKFLPWSLFIQIDPDVNYLKLSTILPAIKSMKMVAGKATVYMCENFTCQSPCTDPDALSEMIKSQI